MFGKKKTLTKEKLQRLPSTKDNVQDFIYSKSKNIATCFNIQKASHFSKSKTISVVFFYKKLHTLCYAIFMKSLNLEFIYKKHDTLRYDTFYIQEGRHYAERKTI